jgi:hypothetical protein
MMRMAARVTIASETSGSSSKGIVTDLGAEMREGRMRSFPRWSGNPAGHRHTETGHDKDDLAGDFGLGLLCRQTSGIKAATDHLFVPKHRYFRQRALSVVDRALPSQSATLLDLLDVPVALGRVGFGRTTRHRG